MKTKIVFIIISLLAFFLSLKLIKPTKINDSYSGNIKPIKDQALAEKFIPQIIDENNSGLPYQVLYRAGKDNADNIYLAYHFIWKNEHNDNSGLLPLLNRLIYTGGLSLQKVMFGKNDIEVIMLKINSKDEICSLIYETAESYNPQDFSVKHKTIEICATIEPPVCLKVISWNHLFTYLPDYSNNTQSTKIPLLYFSQFLWNDFTMLKKTETMLKKSRAHFAWERNFVE